MGQTTFSLLPDCLAARMPGTLEQVQQAARAVDSSRALERAADELRPSAERLDAIALSSAVQWIKRRHRGVLAGLIAVAGLMPETFARCPATVDGFAARLGTDAVLVKLREIAAAHLARIPAPLGFLPRPKDTGSQVGVIQQSMRHRR